ncbi:hypothetical protein TBLA_0A01380 [Henningerozyma blattae CBS 6284]|uniref:Uncharacterized protein n=1 Tax=Henningerozyma blattae (strain ATCC 34711 / CBS 6284 / DSM 70876 / NBRC 10599 / NRRL Y-10934 / UCD 77-7) TaxID=1071380 RepID=I2GUY5_HENB6|nr:hypothetical protein TBLA_0A01380 [Tetrapisispora blattae CBS 6284]CCH57937.1 hypothetical protein TBLA_0A01380 [Tetrapisispora blattae CBS 6284]
MSNNVANIATSSTNKIGELIVLQLIYTFLREGSNSNRVSLVKITNEIQNNELIKRILNQKEKKLDIIDVLKMIKVIFPGDKEKTEIKDGLITFYNLNDKDIVNKINNKYKEYKEEMIKEIEDYDNKIIKLRGTSKVEDKREKLLRLYRDTVVNKLQGKNKILDEMYAVNQENKEIQEKINRIKGSTPKSVHELQLNIQICITECIMKNPIGSRGWEIGSQVQKEFDETVEFMRRALE